MKGSLPLKKIFKGLDFNPVKPSLLLVMLVALLLGCGLPGDPILDDLYTKNVYPGTASTYSIGSEDLPYSEGWFDELHLDDLYVTGDAGIDGDLSVGGETTFSDQVILEGDGKVWLELRPDLDFETVRAHGKPTQVARGIVHGFSLPIYAADNEELFLETHVPHRWDEESDILIHIHCYLDTANAAKNFNLQLSWINFTDDDIIPAGSNDLTVETPTGGAAQYQSFHIGYTIDYDIVPANPIFSSDELHLRVRRLDASAEEIAGEVVITHLGMVFFRDKLGSSTP